MYKQSTSAVFSRTASAGSCAEARFGSLRADGYLPPPLSQSQGISIPPSVHIHPLLPSLAGLS